MSRVYSTLDVRISEGRRSVLRDGQPAVYPRAKVFELLQHLIERRDRLVTREELLERLWPNAQVGENSLSQCINDLRKVLRDDARRPRFIQTVPKVGYRFIAPVEELQESGAGPRPSRSWVAISAVAVFALALASLWYVYYRAHARGRAKRSVAVLFFDNQSKTAELDWLREGLADMFGSSLGRSPKLDVLSRRQMSFLLERSGYSTAKPLRLEDALNIARRGRADLLVLGNFARLGGKIRVGADVHEVASGRLIAGGSFNAERLEDLLSAVDLLSVRLMTRLGAPLSSVSSISGRMPAPTFPRS